MGYAVLIASVVVQGLAAFSAMYIALLRPRHAWFWVAAAVTLMAVRRAFSLASAFYEKRSIDPTAEAIALIISVVMFGGLLGLVRRYRQQQVKPVRRPPSIGPRRLSSLAITLGLLGLVMTLVVAAFAYRASRTAVVESVKANMMSVVRSLRDLALANVDATDQPRAALDEVCDRWKTLARDEPSGYLCIVRADGEVVLNAATPQSVGRNVASRKIRVGRNRVVSFGELGRKPEELAGTYAGLDGSHSLIAVVPAPELDAMICLHVPVGGVDAEVFSGSLPWAVGLGLATLVLLPLSLLLLHRAYAVSQDELAVSHLELSGREDRLRQIIRNMPVMMDALDDDGNLVAWNRECERVTGYMADEVIQNPKVWEELYPEGEYRERMFRAWRDRPEDYRDWEWNLTCRDGTVKRIAWSNCSMEFPISGWSSWSIGVDVTQRKDAELKARQALAQLSRVARANSLGEMATGIAHELNQPLTAISNYAQGGLRRMRGEDYDSTEIATAMDRIAAQAHRAGDIIKRLRGFVAGSNHERVPSDLNEMARAVVGILEPETKMHRVEIFLDLATSLPKITIDRLQIQQVLVNLVQNGIDAIGVESTGLRRVEVATSVADDGMIKTTVRDYGCGLSEESLQFALDPFFTTKADSLGMGLSISRSIVEAHQGELAVDSSCRHGARFYFTLPAKEGMKKHGA